MEEIVKHINDTNASFRTLGAGDAKNTDLFLDNEHYELFRDAGEHITVRFNKENLQKAILFIASILPRKYDNSSIHKVEPFSSAFVFDQLALLDAFFTIDGNAVEIRTQSWNARKDVEKKNGEIDNRFYFNGLLEEVSYKDYSGVDKSAKFTIRNYLAGGYSDLHIKKADDGVFDIWITNALEPKDDGKERAYEIIAPQSNSEQSQIIYYGAPGTGKSHIVKKQTEGESVVRTTFHPDSDYSTFVGCYKPTTKEVEMRDVTGKIIIEHGQPVTENRIIYQFVDQAFLQAYIKAWKFYAEAKEGIAPKKQFLIIEEINRGNCAQIFGDLFQLLDRNDSGFSEYFIHADKDMQKHLSNAFKDCLIKDSHKDAINSLYPKDDDVVAKVLSGEILLLPNNLYIWATMNTSDQSLFPIDSAFKRRWNWEYEPIKYKNINWVIDIEGSKYLWTSFQREINKRIFDATNSEDKMLGDYFVNPADGVITEKILLNKILFYLWNDVCKDGEGDIFKTADNEDVTFSDLHSDGGKDKLIAMMKYLKVQEIVEDTDTKEPIKRKNPKYSINNSKDSYSTPETVCHVIQEYAEQNQGKSVQEMIDIWNGISEKNDCLVSSWAPSPNDKQPFANKRRSEIKWGDKSVWVTRGWTEEIFQTFIRNAKEQLGVIIEKVE